MKKIKLSIIVPVYNVEKYLKRCLESILENTFGDYELIIINDGSKDNSEQVILDIKEKYNDKQDKIIYIKKENSGVSDTRNLGIEKAAGDYITFIDSDDYIQKDMLEQLMKKLNEADYDVVACDVRLVYENSDRVDIVSSGYAKDLLDKEAIKETMLIQYPVMWNKIYKSELIKKLKFTCGVWYEDMEYLLKLYPHINSIGVVKMPLYYYLQRENSITYTYNDNLYDIINNMESVINYYRENNIYDEYKDELEYLYARYAFTTFPKRLAKCKDKAKYNRGIKYAFAKVKEYFPNYKANKYLKIMGVKGIYIKRFNKLLAHMNYIVQNGRKYN